MIDASEEYENTQIEIKKNVQKICKIDDCQEPVSRIGGKGSKSLCREHQLISVAYGGLGRIDRPHTFHRSWVCSECGCNVLEDSRLQDIEDEMLKRTVARCLVHGDHKIRKVDGGDDRADNIISLCYVCHCKKTILNNDHKKNKLTR